MVSLTHTLAAGVARGLLDNLTPQCVTPLLIQHLMWKARSMRGEAIDIKLLQGLSVSVMSRRVTPRKSVTVFPKYGAMQQHANVTHGKAGGVNLGDNR